LIWAGQVLGPAHLLKLAASRRREWVSMGRGYSATHVINTLFNVGLFDELVTRGFVSPDAYALYRNLDASILNTLCEYLYTLRIFQKADRNYALTRKGRLLAEMLRHSFEIAYAYEDVFHFLEPMLRGEMAYGRDVHRKADLMARGSGAGGRLFAFPLVIRLIEERGFTSVLDLACGDGTFLIELCQRNPRVAGYGIDIAADAIEDGRRKVCAAGLQERVHLFAEDMYRVRALTDQIPQVDAVTSFFGFQEFLELGRDRVLDLLRVYRETFPDATLIIFEVPKYRPEELRRRPGTIVEHHLYHALTHQHLATRQEWIAIWEEAGVRHIEERYLDFARMVIYLLRW